MITEATTVTVIRHATEADIPRITEMGVRFIRESRYSQFLTESTEHIENLLRYLINGDGGVLLAERDGTIIGMLGFIMHPNLISGVRTAGELFWWVEPETRGDGIRLLHAVEREARAAGAKALQMIAPDDRVAGIYERLGYTKLEVAYHKAL